MVKTYEEFVKQYGERPPDIVFAVTRHEIIDEIKSIMREAPDLKSLEKELSDWLGAN